MNLLLALVNDPALQLGIVLGLAFSIPCGLFFAIWP
jgi:hypothetical protein